MKVTDETIVELTPGDVTDIIKAHLMKSFGIEIETVRYVIGTHYDDGDWQGGYPREELDVVHCTGRKPKIVI